METYITILAATLFVLVGAFKEESLVFILGGGLIVLAGYLLISPIVWLVNT